MYTLETCKGPAGCAEANGATTCDSTRADVGDPCVAENTGACSVDGKANAASLDDIQSWYVEQGVLPAKQPMDKVLDTAFASAANAALGPFTPVNVASQKPGCR